MKKLVLSALSLLFVLSTKAQLSDSIKTYVDSQLNSLNQSLLDYEENLNLTASQTIITAEDILERGYDNLDELLSSVQGIHITHDRSFTQIGIRGISPTDENNQRVLVLLDNVPLNSPMSGQTPSGFELRGIAMEDIEEVIIIRSPSAIVFGNNALLGVIKINTKKAAKRRRINFDTGNFGELDGGFSLGHIAGPVSFSLSGRYGSIGDQGFYYPTITQIDTFGIPTPITQNGGGMDWGGMQAQLNVGKFSFKGSYNRREGNLTLSNAPPIGESSFITSLDNMGSFKEQQFFSDLSYNGSIGTKQSIYTRIFVNYSKSERQSLFEYQSFGGAFDPIILEEEVQKRKNLWIGFEYEHLFRLQPNHQLLVGTSFWYIPTARYNSEFTFSEFGVPIVDNKTNQNFNYWTYGVFAHDTYRFSESFMVNGGIRLAINSRTKPIIAPQIAAEFTPSLKTNLRFGYSRGYRLPSLLETEVSPTNYPDPTKDLLPEKTNSFELSLQQKIGEGLHLNLTTYYLQLNDLINHNSPYDNVDPLGFTGLEGGLSIDLKDGIKTYLNYNFQFNNEMTFNMPRPLCKFGTSIPFLKHFNFFVEGQYEGRRLTKTETYTQSFFLLNTNLLIRPEIGTNTYIGKMLSQSSLAFRVYNVLDQFYQHPSGRQLGTQLIAQNGRTWQTQLTLEF